MIDFHTHILPGIDDGSASAEESVEMLKILKSQGVNGVVLTPHFYAYKTDMNTFLKARESAFDSLVSEMEKEDVKMDLYLGAEVLYFNELWRVDDLQQLCIEGTKYIILEMPFSKWTDAMINGVGKLVSRGFNPVIAHFDRYVHIHRSTKQIQELVNAGAILQINCDCFKTPFKRLWSLSMLKKGMVSALGTDCHDMQGRKPNYSVASSYIDKHMPEKARKFLDIQQKMIMRNAVKSYDSSCDILKK